MPRLFSYLLMLAIGSGLILPRLATAADEKDERSKPAAPLLWAIVKTIEERHIAPPSRQQMLLDIGRAAGIPSDVLESESFKMKLDQIKNAEDLLALMVAARPANKQINPEEALRKLLQSWPGRLDLVSEKDFKVVEQLNANRYVGTGIQVRTNAEEKLVQVMLAFPNGPARKAGLKTDDLILEVEGISVRGAGMIRKVVDLLRGEEGSTVTLVVRQPGSEEKRTISIVRSVIPLQTVFGYERLSEESWNYKPLADQPIAYVHLSGIRSSTLRELRQLEPRLQAQGCKALVLDLRFESGARLHDVTLLADGLLDEGPLWKIRDRSNTTREVRSDRDSLFGEWPMVVLINPTISNTGMEWLAAALKARGRAVLVGEPVESNSFVTEHVHLPDGLGVLALPTSRVVLPEQFQPRMTNAGPKSKWTVKPDELVKVEQKQRQEIVARILAHESFRSAQDPALKPVEDPQLAKALDVLKAALKQGGAKDK